MPDLEDTDATVARAGGFDPDVERWTLTHGFPDPEDSTRAGLWLEKISHVGLVGGTTSMPDITFEGEPMHNRVDTVDHSPSMNWRRLVGIYTETGGPVQIDYSDPDCVAGSRVPTVPESNTLRCYPVKWTPEGHTAVKTDYFHTYVVDAVTESDLTGGAPRVVNRYTYLGDPAWHFAADDGLLSEDAKTWSSWRGYGADTPVGATADVQCFTYDGLQRLTQAWTPDRATAPAPPRRPTSAARHRTDSRGPTTTPAAA